jgi:ABC-type lipoprotein export system ATPase subunit
MTELSGGQTRALLIADATIICNTPIVLLDEVENAGIHRTRALELLREYRKIFIFVTHDPRIALLSDYRIVMQGGVITDVLHTDDNERQFAVTVSRLDDVLSGLRDQMRHGQRLASPELEGLLCN